MQAIARRHAANMLRSAARSLATRRVITQQLPLVAARSLAPQRASPFTAKFGAIRTMFIQTEATPNPQSIKFLPGQAVLDERFTTGVVRCYI